MLELIKKFTFDWKLIRDRRVFEVYVNTMIVARLMHTYKLNPNGNEDESDREEEEKQRAKQT